MFCFGEGSTYPDSEFVKGKDGRIIHMHNVPHYIDGTPVVAPEIIETLRTINQFLTVLKPIIGASNLRHVRLLLRNLYPQLPEE